MNFAWVPSEDWRRAGRGWHYGDHFVLIAHLKNQPSSSRENDHRARGENIIDGKCAELLSLSNQPILLWRLENGIKTIMFNKLLTCSPQKQLTIIGLLEQLYIRIAKGAQQVSKDR